MLKTLLCFFLALQTFSSAAPSACLASAMRAGAVLRMHVVAQDDTEAMQRVKFPVRDAVRRAYAAASDEADGDMLDRAAALLPALTRAAQEAAASEGFAGSVSVALEYRHFDTLTLDGLTIPAGDYPALMIRLGEARGHNWWGLLDPSLALSCAALTGGAGFVQWDWSLSALWQALWAGLFPPQEDAAHE